MCIIIVVPGEGQRRTTGANISLKMLCIKGGNMKKCIGVLLVSMATLLPNAKSAEVIWSCVAGMHDWSTAGNWVGCHVPNPGDDVNFSLGGHNVNDAHLDIDATVGTIIFDNSSECGFLIKEDNGHDITINNGINSIGCALYEINPDVILGGAQVWDTEHNSHLIIRGDISGCASVHLTGSGLVEISSVDNLFDSTITISGGTLLFGAKDTLSQGNDIIMDGGTLDTGGKSQDSSGSGQGMGTLTLTKDSTIALGANNHAITFTDSSGINWTDGMTLNITGWDGVIGGSGQHGQIFVGGIGGGGLTGKQLCQITFVGYGYGAILLNTGELVPGGCVPETSTWLGISGLIVFVVGDIMRRRRKVKADNAG